MSSEKLGHNNTVLQGDLGGGFNILRGQSADYPAPQLARRFGGISGAYSLRDIGANGTKIVTVRRSSDNETEDFSAEQITNGALAAFVGSGNNGFVNTWYDQSGNGNHAIQLTTSNQPKIVDATSGVLNHLNFDGNVFMDVGAFLLNSTGAHFFMVMSNLDTTIAETFHISNRVGVKGFNFIHKSTIPGKLQLNFIASGAITSNDAVISNNSDTKQLIAFKRQSSSIQFFNNGATVADDGASETYTTVTGTANTSIGKQGNSTGGNGSKKHRLYEILCYDSDLTSDRSEIESDIASYWDITLS